MPVVAWHMKTVLSITEPDSTSTKKAFRFIREDKEGASPKFSVEDGLGVVHQERVERVLTGDQDDEPGDDLDDADDVHAVLGAAREDVVELAREVAGPVVGEDLRELVEPEEDGRDREHDAQQRQRLDRGIAAEPPTSPGARAAARDRARRVRSRRGPEVWRRRGS